MAGAAEREHDLAALVGVDRDLRPPAQQHQHLRPRGALVRERGPWLEAPPAGPRLERRRSSSSSRSRNSPGAWGYRPPRANAIRGSAELHVRGVPESVERPFVRAYGRSSDQPPGEGAPNDHHSPPQVIVAAIVSGALAMAAPAGASVLDPVTDSWNAGGSGVQTVNATYQPSSNHDGSGNALASAPADPSNVAGFQRSSVSTSSGDGRHHGRGPDARPVLRRRWRPRSPRAAATASTSDRRRSAAAPSCSSPAWR